MSVLKVNTSIGKIYELKTDSFLTNLDNGLYINVTGDTLAKPLTTNSEEFTVINNALSSLKSSFKNQFDEAVKSIEDFTPIYLIIDGFEYKANKCDFV